jgi:peptidoglycan/LPS O-acetylase OafA/YrhL
MSSTGSHLRRDIEGLRAIAVIAVVINHTLPAALSGGFCGVDVFFVISGYLIGKHLLEDIQGGQFSIVRFYGRRARRLLPALITVLAAVWIAGWLMLSASEFKSLGAHTVSAAFFSNNLLLSAESGYFDAAATTKPLLHLWSLGIEEQFYLLVPLLLWLGSTGRKASIVWVTRLTVLSLAVTMLSYSPSFYLLDTRFWELGVGVILGYLALNADSLGTHARVLRGVAFGENVISVLLLILAAILVCAGRQDTWSLSRLAPTGGLIAILVIAVVLIQGLSLYRRPGSWSQLMSFVRRYEGLLRSVAGWLGLIVIAGSFCGMTSSYWPGPQTLFPVLGTALVIAAGPIASSNRSLCWYPLVFLGGISYPLYLWHWPILVFWRMTFIDATALGYAAAVLTAVSLAWCTKWAIEDPIRFGRLGTRQLQPAPVWPLALGLACVASLGVFVWRNAGFPNRFSPRLQQISAWSESDESWRLHHCYFWPGWTKPFAEECTPRRRAGVISLLLWGDSHAAHLYPGLQLLQRQENFDVIQWTAAGCPPTRSNWAAEISTCSKLRVWELAHMASAAPDAAVLSAAWEIYLSEGMSADAVLEAIESDVRWLEGLGVRHIVVFGPGPRWDSPLPVALFRYMTIRHTERIPERLGGAVPAAVWQLDARMAALTQSLQVDYLSVLQQFCTADGCLTQGNPTAPRPDLLFRDQDHLSVSGSEWLISAAAPKILPRSERLERSLAEPALALGRD